MKLQNILSYLRRAVKDYNLIQDGDNIAVGLSGGKDSLTLLTGLAAYRIFSPQKYKLAAFTVDLGFEGGEKAIEKLTQYCNQIDVPHNIIKTDIARIIFDIRKEKNPCSLCAKMRRGALCEEASKTGYNKLALGHHADDLSETLFLSMIYEGRLSTFLPKAYMDKTKVTVIRPLIYLREKDLNAFAKDLPVMHNPCPANKNTQREFVKNLIKTIEKQAPDAKKSIFSAIISPQRYNLFDKAETDNN
jgi:tRNA 2-thiocytidine biosynthesis protein TtcA